MTVQLNHTIVWTNDQNKSAQFWAEILGLPDPQWFYHFLVVKLANGVSMDFSEKSGKVAVQHYAFLISEAEFDQVFARLKARKADYWADPSLRRAGEINHNDGGRGVYFLDPGGHVLEVITRPYGGS